MRVSNYKKSNDGISSFSVAATEQEIGVLVNIGLDAMMAVGLLSLEDLGNNGTQDVSLENISQADFFHA